MIDALRKCLHERFIVNWTHFTPSGLTLALTSVRLLLKASIPDVSTVATVNPSPGEAIR